MDTITESTQPNVSESPKGATAAVVLSVYDWTRLLVILESGMNICNRDQTDAIELYQDIASQLSDKPVRVVHSQNPDPQFRPAPKGRVFDSEVQPLPPRRWWEYIIGRTK